MMMTRRTTNEDEGTQSEGGKERNRVRIDVEDSSGKSMEDAPKQPRMAIMAMPVGEMPGSDWTMAGEAKDGMFLWGRRMTMRGERRWPGRWGWKGDWLGGVAKEVGVLSAVLCVHWLRMSGMSTIKRQWSRHALCMSMQQELP